MLSDPPRALFEASESLQGWLLASLSTARAQRKGALQLCCACGSIIARRSHWAAEVQLSTPQETHLWFYKVVAGHRFG